MTVSKSWMLQISYLNTNINTAAAIAPAERNVAMEFGDEAAGIMIRMPDGKRLVRKFKMEDAISCICIGTIE